MKALDALADAWAQGTDLPEAVRRILAGSNAQQRVETLVQYAFTCGAYAANRRMEPQDVLTFFSHHDGPAN